MELIERTPLLAALNYGKGQLLYRLGLVGHHSGSTAYSLSVDEAVRYIIDVAADYVSYGAGPSGTVDGKDILEIGPGDNLGVALMLLAMGAKSVTCIDGFIPRSDESKNRQLYAALYRAMTEDQRLCVKDTIREVGDGGLLLHGTRLRAYYHVPLEKGHEALARSSYDIIVSRAVLEHLVDVRQGWAKMIDALKQTGEMWHKVDFRSHNLFNRIHPLHFLTVNERVWKLISRPDPVLNRARLPLYRELSARHFESSTLYYTHVLDLPEILPHTTDLIAGQHYTEQHLATVRAIRPRLIEPFCEYTETDLLITGAFIISRGKRSGA